MKTTKILAILVLALVLAVCSAKPAEATPMGTAFTYQGHLYDNNDVANGLYDFTFKLYDANTGGSQMASTIDVNDLDVMDGQFTVRLDFGGGVFDGNAIWLETTVAQSDGSDPCTLSPRQELTPTPYALYAASVGDGIGGSGTANYIPRFIGSTTLGNSVIYELAGSIGIGITNPSEKLDVDGHINSSQTYKLDGQTVLSNSEPNSIFVGEGAGVSITTGCKNTAVGYYALHDSNTGNYNSAMGYYALNSNTTGIANTAAGYQALSSNTEGYNNTAVGFDALTNNTIGNRNSAMGRRALYQNTEGAFNSAMGEYALNNNTTGTHNTAMGYTALYSNITGSYNTAVGLRALYRNTEGEKNTAVGWMAGHENSTGNNNVFIGSRAGYNTTDSNNVFLGYQAGRSNISGNGNVFLGYQAGYYETGSDKLYIANSKVDPPLIYGQFDTGRVGIGTTSPGSAKLKISGGVLDMSSQKITNVAVPTANQDAATKKYVDDNVGIPSLKTYDSGWFAISSGQNISKTHDLGTTKILTRVYGATSSTGANMGTMKNTLAETPLVSQITTTTCVLHVGVSIGQLWNGSVYATPTYARIIMLALE